MALHRRSLIVLIFVIDLALINLAITLVSLWHYQRLPEFSVLTVLLNVSWTIVFFFSLNDKFFESFHIIRRFVHLAGIVTKFVSLSAFLLVLLNLDHVSRTMFLGSSLMFFVLRFFFLFLYSYLLDRRKEGPFQHNVLVVGSGKIAMAIQTYYQLNPEQGYIIGFINDKERNNSGNLPLLGDLDDFQSLIVKYRVHEAIITLPFSEDQKIKKLVHEAEYHGVRPAVVANFYSLLNRNYEVTEIGGIPIINIREVPLDSIVARFRKRTFDVVFSSFVLMLLSPLFLLIALAIKLDSRGPVFYRPKRIGKFGDPIRVFKFRSMRHSTTVSTQSTAQNDDRITRVGRFIRKYSLDELPQFINVFLNDMSVVGPRPHREDLHQRFQQVGQNYKVRQYIKPGITGWAQVNGWRGPTENKRQYLGRTLHDLWYLEHWSLSLDFYIIFLTLFGKKTHRNAF